MITPDNSAHLDQNNSNQRIPGPRGLSLLGSLVEYSRTPLEFSLKCARKYGDIVSLSIGPMRMYLLNHPSLIEEVLRKQNQNCTKDISYRVLKHVFGDGLLLSDGELWRRHRKLMQPAFSSDRIANYASKIVADTAQSLTFAQNLSHQAKSETQRYTFAVGFRSSKNQGIVFQKSCSLHPTYASHS